MSSIRHTAVVVDKSKDKVMVSVNDAQSCHSCGLKSACGKSDDDQKLFEVPVHINFKKGEKVWLEMNSELGLKAMLLAYFFPFLVLIISIMIGLQFFNELIASLLGIGLVFIYYWILQRSENLIAKNIHLNIYKTTNDE